MTRSGTTRQLARAALIFIGFVAGAAYAVGPSAESELIALSNAWIDAEVHHDKAALERLLDERFLATFASGKTVDRAAYVDWIMKAEIQPF